MSKVKDVNFKNESVKVFDGYLSMIDRTVVKKDENGSLYQDYVESIICPSCYKLIDYKKGFKEHGAKCSGCGEVVSSKTEDGMDKILLPNINYVSRAYLLSEDFTIQDILNPISLPSYILKRFNVYENFVDGEKSVCISFTLIPTILKKDKESTIAYRGVRTDRVLSVNYTFRGANVTRTTKVFSNKKAFAYNLSGGGYSVDKYSSIFLSSVIPEHMAEHIVDVLGFSNDYKRVLMKLYKNNASNNRVNNGMLEGFLNTVMRAYKFKDLPIEYFFIMKDDASFDGDANVTEIKKHIKSLIETAQVNSKIFSTYEDSISVNDYNICDSTNALIDKSISQINNMNQIISAIYNRNFVRDVINENPINPDQILDYLFEVMFFDSDVITMDDIGIDRFHEKYVDYSGFGYNQVYNKINRRIIRKRTKLKQELTYDGELSKDIIKYPLSLVAFPVLGYFDNIDLRRNFMKKINNIIKEFMIKHYSNEEHLKDTIVELKKDANGQNRNYSEGRYRDDLAAIDLPFDDDILSNCYADISCRSFVKSDISGSVPYKVSITNDIVTERRIMNKLIKSFEEYVKDYNNINKKIGSTIETQVGQISFMLFFSKNRMNIEDSMNMTRQVISKDHLFEMDIHKYINKKMKEFSFEEYHDFLSNVVRDIASMENLKYRYLFSDDVKLKNIIDVDGESVELNIISGSEELVNHAYKANNCSASYENKIINDQNTIIMSGHYEHILSTIQLSIKKDGVYLVQIFDRNNRSLDIMKPDDKIFIEGVFKFCKDNGIGVSSRMFVYGVSPFEDDLEPDKESIFMDAIKGSELIDRGSKLKYE